MHRYSYSQIQTYAALLDRFFQRVQVDPLTKCWNWTGGMTVAKPEGYGRLRIRGRKTLAHRFSFEFFVRPIPEGLTLDHWCRNRQCVNPFHLRPVTNEVNQLTGQSFSAVNAHLEKCRRGHELSIEFFTLHGKRALRRFCYICRRDKANAAHKRRYRERQDAGRCTICPSPLASDSIVYCVSHREVRYAA